MNEELEVLKTVTKHLNDNNIHYMISGSIATNFYSLPRMTRDIDIVIELKSGDVQKIIDLFKNDFYTDKQMIQTAINNKSSFNIIHNKTLVKVDFIIKKDGDYRNLEFKRRKEVEVAGNKMNIVSAEDLVISKLFWAKDSRSQIQLEDVRNILEDVKNIDKDYIKKWIKALALEEIYLEVSNE